MSEYKWIKDHGVICEDKISEEIEKYIGAEKYFLAYSTDSFCAGRVKNEELQQLNKKNLLEVRIFSELEEICFRRSFVGESFQWKIASEEGLSEKEYMVQYQTLDINKKLTEEAGNKVDSFGNRVLYTTVGGKYILPLEGEADSSKIITYIAYDANGIAKAVDYRMCGFVQKFGKERVK